MKRSMQRLAVASGMAVLAAAGPVGAKVTAIRVTVVQSPTFVGRSFGARVEECRLCRLAPDVHGLRPFAQPKPTKPGEIRETRGR